VDRLWDRHVFNCAALAPLIPDAASVVDVGSGAGLPGMVLALARGDIGVLLVEPLLRRVTFLEEATAALGLPNVTVRRDRAESLGGSISAQVVTARAVAPLDRLVRWCLPLVCPGGTLLALKGSTASAEMHSAVQIMRREGAVAWDVVSCAVPGGTPATVVVVQKGGRP
jgi:16S rRNA (guanine527-N7)-methyltransferase